MCRIKVHPVQRATPIKSHPLRYKRLIGWGCSTSNTKLRPDSILLVLLGLPLQSTTTWTNVAQNHHLAGAICFEKPSVPPHFDPHFECSAKHDKLGCATLHIWVSQIGVSWGYQQSLPFKRHKKGALKTKPGRKQDLSQIRPLAPQKAGQPFHTT